MPSVLEELIRKVNSKVAVILAPKRGEIIRELSRVQGFIEPLEGKEEEIKYCRGKFYVMKIYVQS
jgi:hypothetical protein